MAQDQLQAQASSSKSAHQRLGVLRPTRMEQRPMGDGPGQPQRVHLGL